MLRSRLRTTEDRLRGAHRALRVWPQATDPRNLIRFVPAKEAGPIDIADAVPGIRGGVAVFEVDGAIDVQSPSP